MFSALCEPIHKYNVNKHVTKSASYPQRYIGTLHIHYIITHLNDNTNAEYVVLSKVTVNVYVCTMYIHSEIVLQLQSIVVSKVREGK